MWAIVFAKKLSAAGLKDKAQILLDVVAIDPFQNRLPSERRTGGMELPFKTSRFNTALSRCPHQGTHGSCVY